MRCLVLVAALLAACDTGGGGSSLPDADLSLPKCTGALYDSCALNTDCMSMACKLFDGSNIQVCTQTCDSSHPCPAQNGAAATCNGKGICKPPAANACHA